MATRSVATVFGGSGFIGRYIVKRLAQKGFVVRVATRDPESSRFLMTAGAVGQVVPLFASVENAATVRRAVEDASIVVNLVGILAEPTRGAFERVHAEGAGLVARSAAAAGTTHLLHMSAIGADPASPSRYATSKAAGEQAVRAGFPSAVIFRPSIVFGPEDAFFNRFGALARLSPLMPVISGETRMQPVYVGDVADAAMAALARADAAAALYELGGPRVWTFRELLAYVLQQTGRHRMLVNVPPSLARLQARLLEFVPGQPLTRDQLLMLSRDNVVAPGALGLSDLGIVPTPVELVVPLYLQRFRPGGGRRRTLPDATAGTAPEMSFQARDAG